MRRMGKSGLMTKEAADRLGESDRLVRLWCQQGRFPNARLVEHPRGDYWLIPARDLARFVKPKPGPIPKLKAGYETLPTGSVVHWSERDSAGRVKVTCGSCGQARFVKALNVSRELTGYCRACSKPRLTGDEVLPTGSVIHWSEREPGGSRGLPVTCGSCGQKRLVRGNITRANFSGFCRDCARGVAASLAEWSAPKRGGAKKGKA